MLKKWLDYPATYIFFAVLGIVAGKYTDAGRGVHWLIGAACKPNSVCVPLLSLGMMAAFLTVLVYLVRKTAWPKSVEKIVRVLFRVLAHVLIVAVALLALYVLFFFNHIPWFGRYEFPLWLRQWLPPLVVAASYAAWLYRKRLRLQKISEPKSPGQV